MNLYNMIGDWLIDTDIVEQAHRRSDLESRITNESSQIIEHLIKVLKWSDPVNYNKHLKDIDGWLKAIVKLKMKSTGYPKQKDYYKWMFTDNVGDVSDITMYVSTLDDYHHLPLLRNDADLYVIINNIMHSISVDFGNRIFKSIHEYI